MDDAMENKINQEMENNNNENKRHSSKYEDMTGSQGFRIGSLIPPEVSYENTNLNTKSKVVELDEDGNELDELPRLPPQRLPSRYISMLSEDEGSLIPSPGVEEEQICLSPGTPDDVDGGYLKPQTGHLYEEIKEVKRTVEVTPTGSRIFTVEERTRKIPLMRRLTSRMSRKNTIDSDDENIKCTCSKKTLILVAIFILLVLLVIAIVVAVVVTRDKKSEPKTAAASSGFAKDVIYPELTCPPPSSITLSDYSMVITLSGADARDNVGIASLEYIPQLVDNSANYEVPDRLILSRSSVGRKYSVLVKTTDVGGNKAECRYSVTVKSDPCVPWKLPPAAFSTRTEEKTPQGWKVTYQCQGHPSGSDQKRMVPHPLSYHYLDSEVTFNCSVGSEFMPKNPFSCQNPSPALYSYVTSLKYQYLDHDGSKLQNITKEKARSCFENYYKDKLVRIQKTLSESLQADIIDAASRYSKDLSTMELKPSVDYPKILSYNENNGRIQAMNISLGYQVGPPGQVFPTSSLNVFVKGLLRSEHNNLFSESTRPFNRLKGNVNVGCPDIQAPPDSSIFNEVSSGFSCNEGEKKYSFYDDHLNSQVTVCLGCPVGEFYNRDTESCEECLLNMYQDIVGAMECKLCPLNKKTEKTGARSLQECVPL